MDSQRAHRPLRLHDPRDPDPARRRDVARIVAELADADAVPENGLWQAPFWPGHGNPEAFDHLVVAEDRHEGSSLAMLGADVLRSAEEEFLLINTAFVAPVARGRRVLRRMVATVLMQAARQGPLPRVIAARSLNPAFYRAMSRLARNFGVKMYPEMEDGPIPLRAAALARRIARRISPSCRFDPASGVLRGAVIAHGMCGVVQPAPARHAPTDNAFAERLGGADQFLLVLDLRGLDTAAIMETAQRIRRRK
jgi:hypothetical protein